MQIQGDFYTAIAEKLCEIGGIDCVGVASETKKTAISYSGGKVLRKYLDGTKKQSVLFRISGMDTAAEQEQLIKRLCAIGERLTASTPEISGITQPVIRINTPPAPTVRNEQHWIYSMSIEIIFYRKD